MPNRSDAEDHLRVIRSLMERATIYRAISAPAAAVGGFLAIAASFTFGNWFILFQRTPESGHSIEEIPRGEFVSLWLCVLGVTATVNFFFLWRDARRRGDPFISAGMRLALRAVLPTYVLAAWWTWKISLVWNPNLLVPVWMISHGLALLATTHFAPRSLAWLGWAFLLAGVGLANPALSAGTGHSGSSLNDLHSVLTAQMWMACTFGAFHIIYAICAWSSKPEPLDPVFVQ